MDYLNLKSPLKPPLEAYLNPRCPVPIVQGRQEFQRLLEIVTQLRPVHVLEIGSLYGGTLWHWLQCMAPFGQLAAIDSIVPPNDPRHAIQVAGHESHWARWGAERHIRVHTWNGYSNEPQIVQDVQAHFPEGIDFLFIDGGHTLQDVRFDYETYGALVRPGGIIALHDILPASDWPEQEVHVFWPMIRATGARIRELYAAPDQDLWGIGVVER